jgi:hypothetical protein
VAPPRFEYFRIPDAKKALRPEQWLSGVSAWSDCESCLWISADWIALPPTSFDLDSGIWMDYADNQIVIDATRALRQPEASRPAST